MKANLLRTFSSYRCTSKMYDDSCFYLFTPSSFCWYRGYKMTASGRSGNNLRLNVYFERKKTWLLSVVIVELLRVTKLFNVYFRTFNHSRASVIKKKDSHSTNLNFYCIFLFWNEFRLIQGAISLTSKPREYFLFNDVLSWRRT